jgi:hypothetical protein
MAAVVDRFGIERVLTASLALATLTLLAIGQLDPRNWQLIALLLGAGLGGSSQGGINALCGLIYPPALRASGAGSCSGADSGAVKYSRWRQCQHAAPRC